MLPSTIKTNDINTVVIHMIGPRYGNPVLLTPFSLNGNVLLSHVQGNCTFPVMKAYSVRTYVMNPVSFLLTNK